MSFKNEENKLDWMYKSSTSLVNREDYLLGRKIDKSLEKLNTEEKEKELGISAPKNHVEHECIPPSIRDYNRLQATEQQVDIATKLQEDPLVAIKKREEETRKQFLQNPIQLKKIQTLIDTQNKSKKKKKKSKKSSKEDKDDNIASMILEKLQSVKNGDIDIDLIIQQEEAKLDNHLRKKFRKYKEKLSDEDLQEVIDLKEPKETKPPVEENNDSDDNERKQRWKPKSSYRQNYAERNKRYEENSEDDNRQRYKPQSSYRQNYHDRTKRRSPTEETKDARHRRDNHDSDDNDRKRYKPKTSSSRETQNYSERKRQGMSEEEKEAKRREMMDNATWRDKEREKNVKRYKDQDVKEAKQQDFKQEFAHRELLKSANNSTLESRIKSNVNNIQRSRGAMDKNFSRR